MTRTDREIWTAEILSTGDELRTGAAVDTNSAYIAQELETFGLRVQRHVCVGDDPEAIAETLKTMAARTRIVIVTGGLGPTIDDRTAEAAAMAADTVLVESPDALVQMEAFLKTRGLSLSPANRKQAKIPQGAELMANPVGTAPGFNLRILDCGFFFLPGVPREMRVMLRDKVLPVLPGSVSGKFASGGVRVVSTFGLPESAVGERLQPLERRFPGLRLGLRVRFPEIDVRLYPDPSCGNGNEATMADAVKWVVRELGDRVVSENGLPMPAEVGRLLVETKTTLAMAESCTGGMIASMMTDVPGSSAYFLFSGVTYANAAKVEILGVSPETLDRHGAVHEKTAEEMADGARRVVDADYGISTTGIAGPDGGTDDKPVGTVCIGLATRKSVEGFRYVFRFDDRDLNRRIFAVTALNRLRRSLLSVLRR